MGTAIGYVSVAETVNLELMGSLYVASVIWTLIYDTMYGF